MICSLTKISSSCHAALCVNGAKSSITLSQIIKMRSLMTFFTSGTFRLGSYWTRTVKRRSRKMLWREWPSFYFQEMSINMMINLTNCSRRWLKDLRHLKRFQSFRHSSFCWPESCCSGFKPILLQMLYASFGLIFWMSWKLYSAPVHQTETLISWLSKLSR